MALIKCKECGREISSKATSCPHCGAPQPSEKERLSELVKEQRTKTGYTEHKQRKRQEQAVNTKVLWGCLIPIILIFIAGGYMCSRIFSTKDEAPVARRSVDTSRTSPRTSVGGLYQTPAATLERVVEEVVINSLGKNVNWEGDYQRVIGITKTLQVAGVDKGGYLVKVEYRASENITKGMMRSGIFFDAIKLMKGMFQNPRCSEVKICMLMPHLKLVDQYGNEKEAQVAKIVLRRAVADRINWENMYRERFENLVLTEGELWVHPALRS